MQEVLGPHKTVNLAAAVSNAGANTHAPPVRSFVLGPNVADIEDIPITFARGIRDSQDLAITLALRARTAALGTRFVTSHRMGGCPGFS